MDYQTAIDIFDYNPLTGILSWKHEIPEKYFLQKRAKTHFETMFGGKPTGCPDSGGYLQTVWKGKPYRTHRIIWLIYYGVWPSFHIDHEDHNRQNNIITNLRNWKQERNNAHKKNNTSGHPNVQFVPKNTKKPWMVRIFTKGKEVFCESFSDINTAIQKRDEVRKLHNLTPI